MAEKRSLGQKALRDAGKSDIWTASIDDIAETIVSAQQATAEDASEWVLAGLRRNGLLAYRPVNGTLQPAEDSTPSFKELPQSSARLRSEWMAPRFSWLKDGIPSEPDWSLIPGTAAAQELLDWDVSHGDKNPVSLLNCQKSRLFLSFRTREASSAQLVSASRRRTTSATWALCHQLFGGSAWRVAFSSCRRLSCRKPGRGRPLSRTRRRLGFSLRRCRGSWCRRPRSPSPTSSKRPCERSSWTSLDSRLSQSMSPRRVPRRLPLRKALRKAL